MSGPINLQSGENGTKPVVAVFLDNQQYNYFVESAPCPQPPQMREIVRSLQKSGEIEIIGSIELLQEIIEAYPRKVPKTKMMLSHFKELVKNRILWPLSDRHLREVAAGGGLPPDGRYLNRGLRRELERLVHSRQELVDLADELSHEKSAFLNGELDAKKHVLDACDEAGIDRSSSAFRRWYRDLNLRDWIGDILVAGNERGFHKVDPTKATIDNVPSLWTMTSYRLARAYLTIGEGRRIQRSDLADANHAALAPYVDVLVTDDKAMISTCELITDVMGCRVLTSAYFCKEFGDRSSRLPGS